MGRYGYHKDDIAALLAKEGPLNPCEKLGLAIMQAEVAEYEAAHPPVKQEAQAPRATD